VRRSTPSASSRKPQRGFRLSFRRRQAAFYSEKKHAKCFFQEAAPRLPPLFPPPIGGILFSEKKHAKCFFQEAGNAASASLSAADRRHFQYMATV